MRASSTTLFVKVEVCLRSRLCWLVVNHEKVMTTNRFQQTVCCGTAAEPEC